MKEVSFLLFLRLPPLGRFAPVLREELSDVMSPTGCLMGRMAGNSKNSMRVLFTSESILLPGSSRKSFLEILPQTTIEP